MGRRADDAVATIGCVAGSLGVGLDGVGERRVEVDRRAASGASRVGWMNSSDSRAAPVPSATEWWIFQTIAARPPSRPSMTCIIHSGRVRS